MLNRLEPILKGVCVVLAALLLYQVGRAVAHSNPLAHLKIPALPALPADTNAPPSGKATNALGTLVLAKAGTNASPTGVQASGEGTNTSAALPSAAAATNIPAFASGKRATNPVTLQPPPQPGTHSRVDARVTNTGASSTLAVPAGKGGTNSSPEQVVAKGGTNSAATAGQARPGMPLGGRSGMPQMGMNPFGGPAAAKLPDLAPPVLARVDKITDSEILGQVIRPLPKALLGIAGDLAFLRTANGQTGLVKEGDELSGLKLLRIGTNRVLVEQQGKQEELTIFEGYGGESLLPK